MPRIDGPSPIAPTSEPDGAPAPAAAPEATATAAPARNTATADRMALMAKLGGLASAALDKAAAAPASPSSVALVPGRYPDAVDLPTVLAGMGAQEKPAILKLLGQLQAMTG